MPDVKPISDDQELAKVLAGTDGDGAAKDQSVDDAISTLPPVPPVEDNNAAEAPATDGVAPVDQPATDDTAGNDQSTLEPAPATDPNLDTSQPEPAPVATPAEPTGDLASIKASALEELRPLVDKLNVTPQEKFDVLLLLLRSTDDSSLIEQAHAAAKNIVDETSRAQALLDVIKEIDFLSKPKD